MTNREREILKWIEENPMISQNELAEKASITRSSVAVHISNLLKKGKISGKGYILPKKTYISVIGGANVDIAGIPYGNLKDYDSNPGKVSFSFGGVGRNIAENLARLEKNVELITILGDDLYGQEIRRHCSELGIGTNHSMVMENSSTSTYLFILDENKDMKVAIAAMDLYDKMGTEFIEKRKSVIENSKLCITDTNIPGDILEYIVDNFEIPVFIDCVSTVKTEKIKNFIGKFHTVKANRLEAEILYGKQMKNDNDLEHLADYLLKKGVKQIFISLGESGVFYASESSRKKFPAFKTDVVNATGAGDAFMAGIAAAFMDNYDFDEICKHGIAAATIAISSEDTISKEMSNEKIKFIKESNR